MFKNLVWNITRLVCLYTLVAYSFGYLLRPQHWLVGFVQLSIQPALLLCFVLFMYWLFQNKIRSMYPLAILLLGFPFLKRSVQFHNTIPNNVEADFSVLNFNVEGFGSEQYYNSQNPSHTIEAIKFAAEADGDIKCFQDFYNWDETPITGSIKRITRLKTKYFVAAKPKEVTTDHQGNIGLIIFSKYPLQKVTQQMFNTQGNGILVADATIKNKKIRIINTQLQSTGVRVGRVLGSSETFGKESRSLLANLKLGFVNRYEQVIKLESYIKNSPYPVILCGDFNEVPYGHAYGRVSKLLRNAFEEAGNGFGFTLNRSPRFVRIDNQFSSKSLKVSKFETMKEVDTSDHFPIYAEYNF
jgi:endonuclease/exonuclease/phosphatase family metal-dependent hydrolase